MIRWEVNVPSAKGGTTRIRHEGTLDARTISGTWTVADAISQATGTFHAER